MTTTVNEKECIDAFTNQCTIDQTFIPYIALKYKSHVITLGKRLLNNNFNSCPFAAEPNKDEEFIDFIDGNGFTIKRFTSGRIFKITPIIHTYNWE